MSVTLHGDEVRPHGWADCARSFAELAERVQRYLGCETAVLSVDRPLSAHPAVTTDCNSSAAFGSGGKACEVDLRALTNPLVAGEMGMRFYAGLPLRDYQGRSVGILAAMDPHERTLSPEELETLKLLADMASDLYQVQRLGHAA